MSRDGDRRERLRAPGYVSEDWLTRYGSAPATQPHRASDSGSAGDDTRVVVLAFALCIGVFVAAVVGVVLPAAGLWGLAGAAAALGVVGGGSTLLARLIVDGRVRHPAPTHSDRHSGSRAHPGA